LEDCEEVIITTVLPGGQTPTPGLETPAIPAPTQTPVIPGGYGNVPAGATPLPSAGGYGNIPFDTAVLPQPTQILSSASTIGSSLLVALSLLL
jgi:hypothetical protein